MLQTINRIERVGEWLGRAMALAIFPMIAVIMYEVIARYFFNAPTAWAQDVSGWIQVAYVFLGAAWVLQTGSFVRVDIIFTRFSAKLKAWVDLTLTSALFACFAAVLIWHGGELALRSFEMGETSMTGTWGGRVYPAKFLVPIGTILLALSWIAGMMRNIMIIRGEEVKS